MDKVILFRAKYSAPGTRTFNPRVPLGLLFVAAGLVKNGWKVKIIDEEINPHWTKDLEGRSDDSIVCAGISAMTGRQISGGLKFSRILKNKFNIPIVWGGMHASMLPEQTVENDLVDIVVRGEGEKVILKITDALRSGDDLKDIPGIWFKQNGKIHSNPEGDFLDLNSLPPLPYHLLDCEKYIRTKQAYLPGCRRIFELNTDRGCPHRCAFCYNINLNKCIWRPLTAHEIAKQVEDLVMTFALDGIHFAGDNFFRDKKRVVDVCGEIIKRKMRITWHANCRIDYFAGYEDSFIDLLKESGCKALTFGAESGSQRMLDLIQKDISIEQILKTNEKLKNKNIAVNYHFMTGLPEETKKEVIKTYKLMLDLYERHPKANFFGPHVYLPAPGTPLYYRCVDKGFKPPQRLQDWAAYECGEKAYMPFMRHDYLKWLDKSAVVFRGIAAYPRCVRWWFKFRMKIIVAWGITGPMPELSIIRFAKIILSIFR